MHTESRMIDLAGQVKQLAGLVENKIEPALRDSAEAKSGVAEVKAKLVQFEEWLHEVDVKADRDKYALHGDGGRGRLAEAAGKYFVGCVTRNGRLTDEALTMFGVSKAAMQEDVSAEGGFLVPRPMLAEVLRLAAAVAAVRPISRILPMSSKTLDIPDISTEPSVAIIAEEATITESEPAIGQKTLTAKKIAALATMSLEVQQDTLVSLGSLLLEIFAEKIAKKEDEQALEGDGTGSNFTGILNMAGVGSVSVGAALTNLDPFITGLRETLPVEAQVRATWVMHPRLWGRIQKLKDTANNYILNPLPTGGVPLSLFGVPVRLTDQVSVTRGAGNDTTAYVGDFSRLLIGDRMQMSFEVNPFSKFGTAQIDVRILERIGIIVGVPRAFVKLTGITVA